MEKIKIAQIGITHEHAAGKFRSLEKLSSDYEIAGVVNDLGVNAPPEYLADLEEPYKQYPQLTLDEVLNDPSITAVTVEVVNDALLETAIKCAEKGKAIHMDKPAGTDLALYKKLLDTCKAKSLPFQMGYMFRGNPAFKFCIKAIKQKWIGDLITIEADMNLGYGGDAYQTYISRFSGGIMYNLGYVTDKSILVCPDAKSQDPVLNASAGQFNNTYATVSSPYGWFKPGVCTTKDWGSLQKWRLIAGSMVKSFSNTAYLYDAFRRDYEYDQSSWVAAGAYPYARHADRISVAFLDGSAAVLAPGELRERDAIAGVRGASGLDHAEYKYFDDAQVERNFTDL